MRCRIVQWVVSLSVHRCASGGKGRLVGDHESGYRTDGTSGKWACADSRTCGLHLEAASEDAAGSCRKIRGPMQRDLCAVKSCDGEQVRVRTHQNHQQGTRQQITAKDLPYPMCLTVRERTPTRISRAAGQRKWVHQMCQRGSLSVRNDGDGVRCECWALDVGA